MQGVAAAAEQVWLSDSDKDVVPQMGKLGALPAKLRLGSKAAKGNPIELAAPGFALSGDGLTVKFDRAAGSPDGEHKTILFLVGPGVHPKKVTIVVATSLLAVKEIPVVVFHLKGSAASDTKTIESKSATDSPPFEVSLSSSTTIEPKGAVKSLIFKKKGADKEIKLDVSGLGDPVKVGGGKSGLLTLTVAGKELDMMLPGTYEGAAYLVGRGVKEQAVNLIIERSFYSLQSPAKVVEYELAGAPEKPTTTNRKGEFKFRLHAAAKDVKEQVWLNDSKELQPNKNGKLKLILKKDDEGNPVEKEEVVEIDAQGFGVARTASGEAEDVLPLFLSLPKVATKKFIDPGVYEGEVFLVGPGIEPKKHTIKVIRRLFELKQDASLRKSGADSEIVRFVGHGFDLVHQDVKGPPAPAPIVKYELFGSAKSPTALQEMAIRVPPLKTEKPEAKEEVWLNDKKSANLTGKTTLKLFRDKDGKKEEIELDAVGFGESLTITGDDKVRYELKLALSLPKGDAEKRIAAGEYEGKVFVVGAGIKPHEILVRVSRQLFKVKADPKAPGRLAFNLFGKDDSVPKKIQPTLDTANADAVEEVRLSADEKDLEGKVKEIELILKGGNTKITLSAANLGKTIAIARERGDEPLTLTLTRKETIKPGEYQGKVWLVGRGVEPFPIEIEVRRTRLELNAPYELKFDISAKKPLGTQDLPVHLVATGGREKVKLAAPLVAGTKDVVEFVLLDGKKGPSVKLQLKSLEEEWDVSKEPTKIPVALMGNQKLPPGKYEAHARLVGDGVEDFKVTLIVWLDDVYLALLDQDKNEHELETSDEKLLYQLSYFGLAGNTIHPGLVIRSSLSPTEVIKPTTTSIANLPFKGAAVDHLPIELAKNALPTTLEIPASIQEGTYEEKLSYKIERKDRARARSPWQSRCKWPTSAFGLSSKGSSRERRCV